MLDLIGSAGDPTRPLWCIGRDYGREEAERGEPFVGEAGGRLMAALRAAGLRREDVFIDNVVRKQPPGNDWKKHAPGDREHGAERLHSLCWHFRPKVVIAFGNEALEAIVGRYVGRYDLPPITEARGYLWDAPWGGLIMASVHPAAIDRRGQGGLPWVPYRVLLDMDVRKAVAALDGAARPTRETRVVVSDAIAAEMWDEIARAMQEWGGVEGGREQRGHEQRVGATLALDIENTADLALACVGIAVSPSLAYVLPASREDDIARLCALDAAKALQNGAYDRYFLSRYCGLDLRGHIFDTMLAWHALQPELAGRKIESKRHKRTEKGLRFLASVYTNDAFWKSYDFATDEDRYELCGRDCMVTLDVARTMARQLEA